MTSSPAPLTRSLFVFSILYGGMVCMAGVLGVKQVALGPLAVEAGIFAFLLLSFSGIPLTSGFIGKWAVFEAAWRGGYAWLVLAAVLFSLVAAYFYLRVIVVMFFGEPNRQVAVGQASGMTWVPVIVGAVATVYLGLFPGQLLELLAGAEVFWR